MEDSIKKTDVLNVDALAGGAECMGRLADSFEASARRWELIVYPSMVAFILLASYGFYLIYNLTHDIADVAKSVREMTVSVTHDLGKISEATSYMRPMAEDMHSMSGNMDELNTNVSHMQYNMWQLNRNVSAPFNMVDKMMPFGSTRPYGKVNSQITPPLYPRYPAGYAPQMTAPASTAAAPATAAPAARVAYTYTPNRNYYPVRRF